MYLALRPIVIRRLTVQIAPVESLLPSGRMTYLGSMNAVTPISSRGTDGILQMDCVFASKIIHVAMLYPTE